MINMPLFQNSILHAALASYAYLPDMSKQVDEKSMARFTSLFSISQFSVQAIFLLVVSGVSYLKDMDDVRTAQMSQAMNSVIILFPFYLGWSRLPHVSARNKLEPGKSLIRQCFAQNWKTAREINRNYRRSLKWFLLGTAFSEPAAGGFTIVAVVYLSDSLHMSSSQIGFGFFLALIAMIPGSLFATFVAHRTNANTAMKLFCFFLFLLCVIGAAVMNAGNVNPVAYIWLGFLGLGLGAYYPILKLYLSLVVPKSKEAEIVGFFINSCQLLAFLPPLIFSIIVEAGADHSIGLISIGCFFLIALNFFCMAAPFDELLAEVRMNETYDVMDDTKKAAVAELEMNTKGTMS